MYRRDLPEPTAFKTHLLLFVLFCYQLLHLTAQCRCCKLNWIQSGVEDTFEFLKCWKVDNCAQMKESCWCADPL